MTHTNAGNKSLQAQIIAQWITSLAISVICCAILFIVFAGYIVELHDTTNLISVKLEVLQERHNQLLSEVNNIKRTPVVQINSVAPPAAPPVTTPAGVEVNEPGGPDAAKDDPSSPLFSTATGADIVVPPLPAAKDVPVAPQPSKLPASK